MQVLQNKSEERKNKSCSVLSALPFNTSIWLYDYNRIVSLTYITLQIVLTLKYCWWIAFLLEQCNLLEIWKLHLYNMSLVIFSLLSFQRAQSCRLCLCLYVNMGKIMAADFTVPTGTTHPSRSF